VGVAGLALGLAYSAPPIRLCARGLGELDVAVTHSFLVILAGIASQGGPLHSSIAWLLAGPLCLAVLPSITLAGFPDFEADAATGKRTLAVRLGRRSAGLFAGACAVAAAVFPVCLTGGAFPWLWWTSVPAIPHALWLCWHLRRYIRAGTPAGRIDVLLIIGLNFMLWFCLVPLAALLLQGR
jgi:1,4-dihydroxy-2-naphthoate octaprenyltransferase